MSEPKLCPFLTYRVPMATAGVVAGEAIGFNPCLKEKCAMWRTGLDYATARHIQRTPSQVDFDIDCVGYCGLAGQHGWGPAGKP